MIEDDPLLMMDLEEDAELCHPQRSEAVSDSVSLDEVTV